QPAAPRRRVRSVARRAGSRDAPRLTRGAIPIRGTRAWPIRVMTIGVGELAARNADTLSRALKNARRELQGIDADDERRRRADALALVEGYTLLLRQPVPGVDEVGTTYSFKLVLPDGRWWVDEKELPAPPSEGDVVEF